MNGKTKVVWLDGRFVSWMDANVQLLAKVVQYGAGVFEGIRCYETADGPAVFRLKAHIDRLFASSSQLDIAIPFSDAELDGAIRETIKRNGFHSCYIRPICFLGSGSPGLVAMACP